MCRNLNLLQSLYLITKRDETRICILEVELEINDGQTVNGLKCQIHPGLWAENALKFQLKLCDYKNESETKAKQKQSGRQNKNDMLKVLEVNIKMRSRMKNM